MRLALRKTSCCRNEKSKQKHSYNWRMKALQCRFQRLKFEKSFASSRLIRHYMIHWLMKEAISFADGPPRNFIVFLSALWLFFSFFYLNNRIIVEAQRDEEGYCYTKIRKRTGECKKRMKLKQGKGDCCSNGGAGWSLTKRGRDSCEPCKSLFTGTCFIL